MQPLADVVMGKYCTTTQQNESFKKFIEMGAFQIAEPLQSLLRDEKTLNVLRCHSWQSKRDSLSVEFLAENWTDSAVQISDISEEWISERQILFNKEIWRFRAKCLRSDPRLLNQFHNFLSSWFEDPFVMDSPDSFTDTGLIYEIGRDSWRSTSKPAYRVLLDYFFREIAPTYNGPR